MRFERPSQPDKKELDQSVVLPMRTALVALEKTYRAELLIDTSFEGVTESGYDWRVGADEFGYWLEYGNPASKERVRYAQRCSENNATLYEALDGDVADAQWVRAVTAEILPRPPEQPQGTALNLMTRFGLTGYPDSSGPLYKEMRWREEIRDEPDEAQ